MYRMYEAVMHYGESIKAIMNEELGKCLSSTSGSHACNGIVKYTNAVGLCRRAIQLHRAAADPKISNIATQRVGHTVLLGTEAILC